MSTINCDEGKTKPLNFSWAVIFKIISVSNIKEDQDYFFLILASSYLHCPAFDKDYSSCLKLIIKGINWLENIPLNPGTESLQTQNGGEYLWGAIYSQNYIYMWWGSSDPSELRQCNDYGFASKAKPWNWDRVTDTQLVISLRTLGILMWFWMSLLTYKNLFAIQQSSGHKLIYATRGSILVYTSSQAEDFTAVSMDLQLSVPYYHYYLIPLTKLAWWAFMSSNKTNHTVQRKSKLEKDYIAPSEHSAF